MIWYFGFIRISNSVIVHGARSSFSWKADVVIVLPESMTVASTVVVVMSDVAV